MEASLKIEPKLLIYPYVCFDGLWNISDEVLAQVWRQLVEEDKVRHLFYSGLVRSLTDWLVFLKEAYNFPIFVVNDSRIVHVAWLNGVDKGMAWVHHVSVGKYHRGAVEEAFQYWRRMRGDDGRPLLHILLGLTPKTNEKAVRFLKMAGMEVVGEIPYLCEMAYEGSRRVAGIISYHVLNKSEG